MGPAKGMGMGRPAKGMGMGMVQVSMRNHGLNVVPPHVYRLSTRT